MLWCWPTTSEMDVDCLPIEAEPFWQYSIAFLWLCNMWHQGTVWQNDVWHVGEYEEKEWNWTSPCGTNGTHWHPWMFADHLWRQLRQRKLKVGHNLASIRLIFFFPKQISTSTNICSFLDVVEILQAVNEQTGLLWLGDELFSLSQSEVQAKSTIYLIFLLIFHYYIWLSPSLVMSDLISRGAVTPAVYSTSHLFWWVLHF